jgi:MOSC domain-containing protein YiiM
MIQVRETMQLISVNIGQERALDQAKPSGKTGIYKQPSTQPVRISKLGLEGDVIIDVKNHGGFDQAVYIYGSADYAWWAQELGRALDPGTFGENLTISDLESAQFSVGDRLQFRQVLLEVSAPRIPCVTLAARMGDKHFIQRFREAQRPGLYCRVIAEGSVQVGETIAVVRYPHETVTALEMFNNFYLAQPDLDYLRRYLQAPTPIRGRKKVKENYRERFVIEDEPAAQDIQFLEDRIIEFNYAATGYRDGNLFGIFLRDADNEIYAGISGFTWGGTAKVERLWVRDDWRGKNLGQELLARGEEEAIRRGCKQMVLDTHSFQALGFYQKQGYAIAGKLEDFPLGFQSIYLCKRLA